MAWYSLGLLALISFALAAVSYGLDRRRSDLLGAACILALTWPLTDLVGKILSPPQSMLLGPMVDLCFATGLGLALRQKFEWWKLALVTLLAIQAVMHIAYQANSDHPEALLPYLIELNTAYGLQLCLVGLMGGRDVVLHYCRPGRGHAGDQLGHKGLG